MTESRDAHNNSQARRLARQIDTSTVDRIHVVDATEPVGGSTRDIRTRPRCVLRSCARKSASPPPGIAAAAYLFDRDEDADAVEDADADLTARRRGQGELVAFRIVPMLRLEGDQALETEPVGVSASYSSAERTPTRRRQDRCGMCG